MSCETRLSWLTQNIALLGLGISREAMPQITSEQLPVFIAECEDAGISVCKVLSVVNEVRPTQDELNPEKVQEMIEERNMPFLRTGILGSLDSFILDGHHRWAALWCIDQKEHTEVTQFDLPIAELLEVAHAFDGTEYRSVEERKTFRLKLRESVARARTWNTAL